MRLDIDTLSASSGGIITLADTLAIAVGASAPDGFVSLRTPVERQVQEAPLFRAAAQSVFPRFNSITRSIFVFDRIYPTFEDAAGFIAGLDSFVPFGGNAILSLTRMGSVYQTWYLPGCAVKSIEPETTGCTVQFTITLVGGSWSKSLSSQ